MQICLAYPLGINLCRFRLDKSGHSIENG